MTEPKNAIYRQYIDILGIRAWRWRWGPPVFEQIADVALEYKTGARGLRGIFEGTDGTYPLHHPRPSGSARRWRSVPLHAAALLPFLIGGSPGSGFIQHPPSGRSPGKSIPCPKLWEA